MSQAVQTDFGGRDSPDEVRSYRMWIGDRQTEARDGNIIETIDPFTGKVWATVPAATGPDVDAAVDAAREAFVSGPWPTMLASQRGRVLRAIGDAIADHAERLARIETYDNGKLLREMRAQLEGLPEWYYYFAGAADKIHGETIPSGKPNVFTYTRREPIGVVGVIVPWNSPLELLTWKLAPALAAGCTVVAKPAEQTSVSTLEFAELLADAGLPPGVFNVVTGTGQSAGVALTRHPGIDKIAFTGSTETGKRIMSGAADHIARVTLELGGKSANIVMEDADLELAASGVVAGVFGAAGQTCVAGARVIVHEAAQEELSARIVEIAESIRLGDPLAPETEMGPLAFEAQRDKVENYIRAGHDEGATLLCGGARPIAQQLETGYFVEPTVFANVSNASRIAQEEIFGPVLCILPVKSDEEAVRMANESKYGLAAGVWTNDLRRAHRMAHALRVGTVWVNCYRLFSPSVPFGGMKQSGMGREMGTESLSEYVETKSIWIETESEGRDPYTIG